MKSVTIQPNRDWTRYQWASISPSPDEDASQRWNLVQWVGDQGAGHRPAAITATATMPAQAGPTGFSGDGHTPGVNHWAGGYRH